MNNTTAEGSPQGYLAFNVLLYIFLILSVLGNSLLIIAIVRDKHLRSITNYLVVNLAICDMVNVLLIPFTIASNEKLITGKNYPFGMVGCKIIVPVNTYIKTTGLFSLVCIAFEGYRVILFVDARSSKQRTIAIFILIHTLGILIASPTFYYWTVIEMDGCLVCLETLEEKAAYDYTICLFIFQYLLPLFIIAVLYSLAWYRLQKRNKKMIEMSEDYERKMAWSNTDNGSNSPTEYTQLMKNEVLTPAANNKQNKQECASKHNLKRTDTFSGGNVMRTLRRSRKSTFISETAFMRHKQTKKTLKMFIAVVLVFATLQLPNQILWLSKITTGNVLLNIFIVLAHVSPVINCWIYGVFNKRFRKAYMAVIRTFILRKRKRDFGKTSIVTTVSKISRNSSFYDNKKQQEFQERQSTFTDMFEYHEKHFDQFKHLYNLNEEQETIPKPITQKPKRKITIANFFHVLRTPTMSTHSLDKTTNSNNKSGSIDFLDDGCNSCTDKSRKKKSSNLSIKNSYPIFKSNSSTSRNPSPSSIKPKRKITLANFINVFKAPTVEHRNYSLPSLEDDDDKIEKLSSLSTSNDSKSLGNMNAKNVENLAPSATTGRKGSIWSIFSPLFISKNNSSPNLTQKNSYPKSSEIISSCESMCMDVTNDRTNSTTCSSTDNNQHVNKQSQKEPIRYSKMKQKFKQINRSTTGKSKRGGHTVQQNTFENEPQEQTKENNESTALHQQKPRTSSLTDKRNLIQPQNRRASIGTIPKAKIMHLNINLSNITTKLGDCTSLPTSQTITVDSQEYFSSERESIPSPITKRQQLQEIANGSQITTEPRRRKNASISLHQPIYYDDFEDNIKYIAETPTIVGNEADKDKCTQPNTESTTHNTSTNQESYMNAKTDSVDPIEACAKNNNTKMVPKCYCKKYDEFEEKPLTMPLRPTTTVKSHSPSTIEENEDNNNKNSSTSDKINGRPQNNPTVCMSEEINPTRNFEIVPQVVFVQNINMNINGPSNYKNRSNSDGTDFYYNNDTRDSQWRDGKNTEYFKNSELVSNHVQNGCDGKEWKNNTSDNNNSNITIPTHNIQKNTKKGKTYKTLPLLSKCFSRSDSSVEDVVLITKIDALPSFTRRTKLTDHVNSRIAEARKKDIVDA